MLLNAIEFADKNCFLTNGLLCSIVSIRSSVNGGKRDHRLDLRVREYDGFRPRLGS